LNTRNLLIAGVAVVALVGAGAAWMYYGQPGKTPPSSTGPDTSADLMVPGPLGEQVLGNDNAPVTIIEYASMTCPHCANFHETTYPELKKRYIDTGKVRFIFREFPLESVAATAAMLARCANKDKFFPMIEVLFQQQNKWAVGPPASPLPPLLDIAKQAGFTEESFNACLKDQKILDGIKWSYDHASQLGVQSTPSFFINGKLYPGGMTIERLEELITPYLKS
jgi:protein-disulfide isomerase